MVKMVISLENMGDGLEMVLTVCVAGEKAGFTPCEE
jgi:hypothetical protein